MQHEIDRWSGTAARVMDFLLFDFPTLTYGDEKTRPQIQAAEMSLQYVTVGVKDEFESHVDRDHTRQIREIT